MPQNVAAEIESISKRHVQSVPGRCDFKRLDSADAAVLLEMGLHGHRLGALRVGRRP